MEGAGSHWQKFRLYIKSSGTPRKGQRHGIRRKIEGDFRIVPWDAAQRPAWSRWGESLRRWMQPQLLIRIKDSKNEGGDEQKQTSVWQVQWTGHGDRLEAGGGREKILTQATGQTEGKWEEEQILGGGNLLDISFFFFLPPPQLFHCFQQIQKGYN